MEVLVIGAGVSGLSCGLLLLEAGFGVRLWAREPPARTTSNVAAAVWYPYRAYPEGLVARWSAAAYAEFLGLSRVEGAGVRLRPTLELFRAPVADPWWRDALPAFRRATGAELLEGYRDGYAFEAPVIEMPRYLDFLLGCFTARGGRLELRELRSLEEAFAAHDGVVNCAGLGARELVGDRSMLPIRGQIVRVAQVGLERVVFDDTDPERPTYIVPRSEDCVLGGTSEDGREELTPDPATARDILERCAALEPRLRGARILSHHVGLRPGRPSVRLEVERRGAGKVLVHDYGHGGAGVTLSWGCARDVVARLKEAVGFPAP